MIHEEENNKSYIQTPNFSPSPLKSRISRLSRKSKGDVTPETALSKSVLDNEMKHLEEKILDKSRSEVKVQTEKFKNEVTEFMREIIQF